MAIYLLYLTLVCLTVILIGNAQVRGESLIEYIIWPRTNVTGQDVDRIENLLRSLTLDPTRLYVSRSPSEPIPTFWLAVLNDDSYQRISRHPNVSVKVDGVEGLASILIDITRYSRWVLMKTLSSLRT